MWLTCAHSSPCDNSVWLTCESHVTHLWRHSWSLAWPRTAAQRNDRVTLHCGWWRGGQMARRSFGVRLLTPANIASPHTRRNESVDVWPARSADTAAHNGRNIGRRRHCGRGPATYSTELSMCRATATRHVRRQCRPGCPKTPYLWLTCDYLDTHLWLSCELSVAGLWLTCDWRANHLWLACDTSSFNVALDAGLAAQLPADSLRHIRFRFLSESQRMLSINALSGVITTADIIDRDSSAICRQMESCEINVDVVLQPVQFFQVSTSSSSHSSETRNRSQRC